MPSPERIEQLHEQLVPLGNEPAVAAERGETVEPPSRPADNLDDDLSAMLDDAETDTEAFSAPAEDDTSALLSDLDSVFDDDSDEAGDEEPVADEDDPFAGLDLGGDDVDIPADMSFDTETDDETADETTDETDRRNEPLTKSVGDLEAPDVKRPKRQRLKTKLKRREEDDAEEPDETDDIDDALAAFDDDSEDTDDIHGCLWRRHGGGPLRRPCRARRG